MRKSIKLLIMTGFAIGLLVFSGCKHYKVVMTLNKDGSGTRKIEVRASTIGEDDFEIEIEDFRELFGLSEKRGWKLKREVKPVTDEAEVAYFTLDSEAKRISSWQALSGDLDIRGSLEEGPLEDVRFHNDIEVVRSEGNTITYRETLTWNKLKERAIDLNAAFFARRLVEEYPFLTQEDQNEIQYFLAGMITVSWYAEEVADDQMSDELYTQAAGDYVTYMVEERYPDRNASGIADKLKRILVEEGEEYLDHILKEKLPGAYLAGHTSITYTITMPGKILESNATSVEGNTAVWKYDMLLVSFNHPVKLYIKSEIDD